MSAMSSQKRKGNWDAAEKARKKDPSEAEFFKKRLVAMQVRQWVREHLGSGLVARDED